MLLRQHASMHYAMLLMSQCHNAMTCHNMPSAMLMVWSACSSDLLEREQQHVCEIVAQHISVSPGHVYIVSWHASHYNPVSAMFLTSIIQDQCLC